MDEQMQLQIVLLVQAAMQGDQQAQQQVQQIMQAAQQGDPQAQLIAQMIQAVVQQMQGAQMARFGAKLNYINFLRGKCPEGYEMQYFKNGGKAGCKKCQKAEEGEKMDTVTAYKCGRKMKKKAQGGEVETAKCGKKVLKHNLGKAVAAAKNVKATKTTSKSGTPTTKEWTLQIGNDVTLRNRDTGSYRREIVEAKGFPNDTNYYYFPEKGPKQKISKESYNKAVNKKANGGTLDIFAPYRNLKLK